MGSRNKIIKDKGKSIRVRLLNISKETPYDYNVMLARYVQERVLYRLSQSQYNDRLFLKGGALLYVYSQMKSRPTLDIDFLIKDMSNDKEIIKKVFQEILSVECTEDALSFDVDNIMVEDIMETNTYHGVRINITALIDGMRQPLSVDIGFGDVIVPAPHSLEYPLIFDEMPTFSVNAYSLETVVAEKFQTMIALSIYNSRMKDFYDLYTILSAQELNKDDLKEAIVATFTNRNTGYTENHLLFKDDFFQDAVKNKQWNDFMKKVKSNNQLSFADVGKYIQQEMKPYWDALNKK